MGRVKSQTLTNFLENIFHITAKGSTISAEIIAGLSIFMAMVYILPVNTDILSATGMDPMAVYVATACASFIGCFLMGFLANLPVALAPGMGLNAFFSFTVCLGMGYSWQFAITAVAIEGVIFIILSLTGVREAIFNAIPKDLKLAVSAGIGLFIAYIGLQNSKLVVANSSTISGMYDFQSNPINPIGITVIITVIGLFITAALLAVGVKGAILIGIIATWVLGVLCQLIGFYTPNAELGMNSLLPSQVIGGFEFSALSKTAFKFELPTTVKTFIDLLVVLTSFLFVDVFDTIGTLIGVATKANLLDENGKLPKIKFALLADALATLFGAFLGTSTTTSFIESTTGDGKTGLTPVVVGILFILAIPFAPLILAVPSFATAPALILVGAMMITNLGKVNWKDYRISIPVFLCVLFMIIMYSISEGLAIGIISYVVINLFTSKSKKLEPIKVQPIMYVLSLIFVAHYFF